MLTAAVDSIVLRPLLERLADARRKSDGLFALVQPDSIFERPIPERHRIIFYVGHLEAFDWNLLHEALGCTSSLPDFDRLFAFGIDPVGAGLPTDQSSDWPTLNTVRDYVSNVRGKLEGKLRSDLDLPSLGRDEFPLDTLLNVAIEHRLMHLETLSYMLHQLPLSAKIKKPGSVVQAPYPVSHSMVHIPAGSIRLGLSSESAAFGWDNEFESYLVDVPAFEIDRYMVTNGQFLEFVHIGGYEDRSLWSDSGWDWRTENGINHPVFWMKSGAKWLYRTMFENIDLPLQWPVYVSHAEASAYARWAGKILPSEEQWHRAAYGTPEGVQRFYPWGNESPNSERGNFDFHHWDPTPVNAFPQGQSAFAVEGMLGNGWEWTSTIFGPYPGFQPFPFYRGYSADFFDAKHFVMKGGSARTATCMLRPTFRNWFQSHYQYVYAGFRCVSIG